jgi:hypothetical protein
LVLHFFNITIPSLSEGFYKFYSIFPFSISYYLFVCSHSSVFSFFYGSTYLPYNLPFKYSVHVCFSHGPYPSF